MTITEDNVTRHSVHTLVFRSLKRTHDMFISDQANLPPLNLAADALWRKVKARSIYGQSIIEASAAIDASKSVESVLTKPVNQDTLATPLIDKDVVPANTPSPNNCVVQWGGGGVIQPRQTMTMPKPTWHPPWKLYRVISGHMGWVRCLAVEPANEWFVTGAADRIIKIWDLATGRLKLSLTGHVSTVRGLAVSSRHPYLFSAGEDRQVKCWDLEYNKVIRHYHGHLSAVHALSLHPTLDVLVTAGRDSTARVWDMRTKVNIHVLSGHTNTVASVACQAAEPQIITASHDSTVRLWDLATGKSRVTLTNHKKSVRAVVNHPSLYMFASASPDNIKQWRSPNGVFIQNLTGHSAIINCLAVNADNVLVSGADNGTLHFWDWKTGYNFQRCQAPVQPGSLDSEAGIFGMTFDMSGSRLITVEADKTIKIYKEDDEATPETHPINWKPEIIRRRKY